MSHGAATYATLFYDIKRYGWQRVYGGRGRVAELKRWQVEREARQSVDTLKRRGYLRARRIGNRVRLELTDKGQLAALRHELRSCSPLQGGRYVAVVFDVPETERRARQHLRLFLKANGFRKLQQSVWLSNHDTYQVITRFVRHLGIATWVSVMRINELSR